MGADFDNLSLQIEMVSLSKGTHSFHPDPTGSAPTSSIQS